MSRTIKTPFGTVPEESAPKYCLVRDDYLPGKPLRREPIEYLPCAGCGELSTGHTVSRGGRRETYCCECYVREFDCPADWHPECVRVANEIRGAGSVKLAHFCKPDNPSN